jgi:hypothetical protein
MGDYEVYRGIEFAPSDHRERTFGNFHAFHKDAEHLKPGDKILIEATVRSANLIYAIQQCRDYRWRQIPSRVVELQSGFTFTKVES